ncbi:ABC transporter permease [Nocardiopsis sp. HNM0947]|uniref:ABC transporter permease n=1 Tax=Nocardiopsis coralli TaxID=2772213 RepID=A0ABR9PDT5_9ACTN|nr:ABC transporter permease [Nocardiopsis coralli]
MRRLRAAPSVAVLVTGVVVLSSLAFFGADPAGTLHDPAARPWHRLIEGLALAAALVSPVLLAVLASRQVDIEHRGNGWLFQQTSGLPPGRLCRAKFAATGALVVAATALQSALVAAVGLAAGISVAFPAETWLSYTAALVVINLVLLALHTVLSACVPNQLVGLGVGVLGVFVTVSGSGMPPWLAHLVPPWGYYGLATPVDSVHSGVVDLDPHHLSIAALGVVGGALFLAATRLLDRGEA